MPHAFCFLCQYGVFHHCFCASPLMQGLCTRYAGNNSPGLTRKGCEILWKRRRRQRENGGSRVGVRGSAHPGHTSLKPTLTGAWGYLICVHTAGYSGSWCDLGWPPPKPHLSDGGTSPILPNINEAPMTLVPCSCLPPHSSHPPLLRQVGVCA